MSQRISDDPEYRCLLDANHELSRKFKIAVEALDYHPQDLAADIFNCVITKTSFKLTDEQYSEIHDLLHDFSERWLKENFDTALAQIKLIEGK